MQTHLATQDRRKEVYELMLLGKPTGQIKKELSIKYGVAESTITTDVNICYKELRELWKEDREDMAAKSVAMLLQNIQDARNAEQYFVVTKTIEVLTKITGVMVNGGRGDGSNTVNLNFNNLSVEEIKNLLTNTNDDTVNIESEEL